MAQAAVLANLGGPPMGTVNLKRFTVGVNVPVGALIPRKIDVEVPGVTRFNDVPSSGVGLSPRIFAGVNLGWVLGMFWGESEDDTPAFYSPRRFDIYVSALDAAKTIPSAGGKDNGDLRFVNNFRGIDIKYHLVEGNSLLGPFLKFNGVSVGVGYYRLSQGIHYLDKDSPLKFSKDGTEMKWNGADRIDWNTRIETYPVELRTGIQAFYFLNLTVAGGVAFSKGSNDFTMQRSGTVFTTNNQLAALGITIPDSKLSMQIMGNGSVPARMPYAKLGVEFNVTYAKISIEGMASQRGYGVNLGARFEM
jgi:hypothetical protein